VWRDPATIADDATTMAMTTNDRTGSFIYRDGAGNEAVGW
jgi:hypothetical protein